MKFIVWIVIGLIILLLLGIIIWIIRHKKTEGYSQLNLCNKLIANTENKIVGGYNFPCSYQIQPFSYLPPPPGNPPYIIDVRTPNQYFMQVTLPMIISIVKTIINVALTVYSCGSSLFADFKSIKNCLSAILTFTYDAGKQYILAGQIVGSPWTDPSSSGAWSASKKGEYLQNLKWNAAKTIFDQGKAIYQTWPNIRDKIITPTKGIGALLKNSVNLQQFIKSSMNTGQFVSGYTNVLQEVQQMLSSSNISSSQQSDLNNLYQFYEIAYNALYSSSSCSNLNCGTISDTNEVEDLWNIQSPFSSQFNTNFLDFDNYYSCEKRQAVLNFLNTLGPPSGSSSSGPINAANLISTILSYGLASIPFGFIMNIIEMIIIIMETQCLLCDVKVNNSDEWLLPNEYSSYNAGTTGLSYLYNIQLIPQITNYTLCLLNFLFPSNSANVVQICNNIQVIKFPPKGTIVKGDFANCCNDSIGICGNTSNTEGFISDTNSMPTFCGAQTSNNYISGTPITDCYVYYYYCDSSNCDPSGTPNANLNICSTQPFSQVETLWINPNSGVPSENINVNSVPEQSTFGILDRNYCPPRMYLSTTNLSGSTLIGSVGYSSELSLTNDYTNSMYYCLRMKDICTSLGDPFGHLLDLMIRSDTLFPTYTNVYNTSSQISYLNLPQAIQNTVLQITSNGSTYVVIPDGYFQSSSENQIYYLGCIIPTVIGNYNISFNTASDTFKSGTIKSFRTKYRYNDSNPVMQYNPTVNMLMAITQSNCTKLAYVIGDISPDIMYANNYNIGSNYNVISFNTRMSYIPLVPTEIPLYNDIDGMYDYQDNDVTYINSHISSMNMPNKPILNFDISFNQFLNTLVPSVMFFTRQINLNPYNNASYNCISTPGSNPPSVSSNVYAATYLTDFAGYTISNKEGYLYVGELDGSNNISLNNTTSPITYWKNDMLPGGSTLDNFIMCINLMRINPNSIITLPLIDNINVNITIGNYAYQVDISSSDISITNGTPITIDLSQYITFTDPYNVAASTNPITLPLNDIICDYQGYTKGNYIGIQGNFNVTSKILTLFTLDGSGGQTFTVNNLLATLIIPTWIYYPLPTRPLKTNMFYQNPQTGQSVIDQSGCYCWQLNQNAVSVLITIPSVFNIGHVSPNSLNDLYNYGDKIGALPEGFPLPVKDVIVPTNYTGNATMYDQPIYAIITTVGYIYLYKPHYTFNGMVNQIYNNLTIYASYVSSTTNSFIVYSNITINNNNNANNFSFYTYNETSIDPSGDIYGVNSYKFFLDIIDCNTLLNDNTFFSLYVLDSKLEEFGNSVPFNYYLTSESGTVHNQANLQFNTTTNFYDFVNTTQLSQTCNGPFYIQGRLNSLVAVTPGATIQNQNINIFTELGQSMIKTGCIVAGNFTQVNISANLSDSTCKWTTILPYYVDQNKNIQIFYLGYISGSFNTQANSVNMISFPISATINNQIQSCSISLVNEHIKGVTGLSTVIKLIINNYNYCVTNIQMNNSFVYSPLLGCSVFRDTINLHLSCQNCMPSTINNCPCLTPYCQVESNCTQSGSNCTYYNAQGINCIPLNNSGAYFTQQECQSNIL